MEGFVLWFLNKGEIDWDRFFYVLLGGLLNFLVFFMEGFKGDMFLIGGWYFVCFVDFIEFVGLNGIFFFGGLCWCFEVFVKLGFRGFGVCCFFFVGVI